MRENASSTVESPSVLYRDGKITFEGIWTASARMRKCLDAAGKMAALPMDLLILGETGTGKNLIAAAIHNASPRAEGPFVEVNTGAIPQTLAEDALFGHEPEAFTEARTKRRGCFEQAHGGTLFLDEIGNMTADVQAKILTAVERKRIRRLGGENEVQCDVRLVCATKCDVRKAIAAGAFRDDLYYRIAGHEIRVPPLRERREDIPLLAERFIALDNVNYGRSVERASEACMAAMLDHPWPGNVRELRRRIGSAVALCEGAELLPAHVFPETASESDAAAGGEKQGLSLAAAERNHMEKVLALTGWNISEAARLLDITRQTLRTKISAYGLRRPTT
ncbi:MAG: sigma-54-dependent Fis family transcriptional regulator [Planctomycetes bacterium]|nr:sigma-54-dependent Fis family transcriptional regulator [Planctomycetota bacterium]